MSNNEQVFMNKNKIIKCSRILHKLNSFLEKEFDENGISLNFQIWSDRYDKISSYYRKLVGLPF